MGKAPRNAWAAWAGLLALQLALLLSALAPGGSKPVDVEAWSEMVTTAVAIEGGAALLISLLLRVFAHDLPLRRGSLTPSTEAGLRRRWRIMVSGWALCCSVACMGLLIWYGAGEQLHVVGFFASAMVVMLAHAPATYWRSKEGA
jgi:hypothetical protein